MTRNSYPIKTFPTELIFWCLGILGILLIDTESTQHFTLCPIGLLGFEWCPGCGLGRSMKLLIEGNFKASWEMHPLAGLAWIVILLRIFNLIKHLKAKRNYG
ncbi:DUF2752 domain-containing protein [Echinicola sp. 20G]|uniref:DUF2752 domain-containing protein n=1 Tax=Echinicola sp. 20G TaxID=2781961 RepID=UPI0019109D11|nr:DUF2752 domain-containing protein [Echinicola sp. 20G]